MSGKRRQGARIALFVLFGLSLSAPVARSQTIVRSVVGSGWGWDPIIKPGFAWQLLGTVGQGGAGEFTGGADGWYIGSGFWTPWEPVIGTGVDEPSSLGPRNRLEQNIPNPFNPTTTISFSLVERGMVELTVLDVRGRVLEVLLREERDAGVHQIEYRPTHLPSGVYFYRLRTGNFVQTRRFVLLK